MQYRHVLPQAGSLHERDSSLMLHVLFRVFRPAGGKNRLYPKNTLLFQTRQYPSVSETVQSSIPCTFVPPMRLFRFAFLHLPIKKQEPPSAAPVSFFHVMHSRRQPARSPTPLRTSRIIQGAELLPYQTSEPRGLSPSGGNSAAQLHVPYAPARLSRAVRAAGLQPCLPY